MQEVNIIYAYDERGKKNEIVDEERERERETM